MLDEQTMCVAVSLGRWPNNGRLGGPEPGSLLQRYKKMAGAQNMQQNTQDILVRNTKSQTTPNCRLRMARRASRVLARLARYWGTRKRSPNHFGFSAVLERFPWPYHKKRAVAELPLFQVAFYFGNTLGVFFFWTPLGIYQCLVPQNERKSVYFQSVPSQPLPGGGSIQPPSSLHSYFCPSSVHFSPSWYFFPSSNGGWESFTCTRGNIWKRTTKLHPDLSFQPSWKIREPERLDGWKNAWVHKTKIKHQWFGL